MPGDSLHLDHSVPGAESVSWAQMKTSLLLLCYLWLLSLTPVSQTSDSAQDAPRLTCWYDSRAALFCDWNPGRELLEAPCQLEILSRFVFCNRYDTASQETYLARDFTGCLSSGEGQCDRGSGWVACDYHRDTSNNVRGIRFSLLEKFTEHCELPKAEHTTGLRRCVKTFSRNSNTQCFTTADRLSMSVHCQIGENRSIPAQIDDFRPLENIRLRPPGNLQLVSRTDNTYNLTWSLNISSHYLDGDREYQVRYRTTSQSWEEAKIFTIVQDQMWVVLERLLPDLKYEAAVRARPSASSICKGVWSGWSETTLWRTHADQTSQPVLPALLVSTCIFVIVGTAFLINSRTLRWEKAEDSAFSNARSQCLTYLQFWAPQYQRDIKRLGFKKTLKIHIPDPEKFFPPLVSVHRGDIQKWLSSPFSTSSFCVNSITPEISVLEVMQKHDQESQFLLSKGTLTPDAPLETSGHSASSCFTNQGYFFFHLPNSFEIEPCQVYFTYEPFTQEGSGSEGGESYHALPSPDLCTLEEDKPMLSHDFLHCTKVTQGLQNDTFLEERESEDHQAMATSEDFQSSEDTSPTQVLKQAEEVPGAADLQPAETLCQSDSDSPDTLDPHNSDIMDAVGGSSKADSLSDPCTPAPHATSPFSQPQPLRQMQDEDPCGKAFSSQVPNTGAYLSLKDLQSQYSRCSV